MCLCTCMHSFCVCVCVCGGGGVRNTKGKEREKLDWNDLVRTEEKTGLRGPCCSHLCSQPKRKLIRYAGPDDVRAHSNGIILPHQWKPLKTDKHMVGLTYHQDISIYKRASLDVFKALRSDRFEYPHFLLWPQWIHLLSLSLSLSLFLALSLSVCECVLINSRWLDLSPCAHLMCSTITAVRTWK